MKRFKRVYVEITNACNLACPFCAPNDNGAHFMSTELFTKCCTELSPLTDEITMHLLGEPTFHPLFPQFTDIAAENNLKICLTTNGTLTDHIRRSYKPGKFSQINFSIHALLESNLFENQIDEILKFIAEIKSADQPFINFRYWSILNSKSDSFASPETIKSIEYIVRNIEPAFDMKLLERIDTDKKYKSIKLTDKIYFHFNKRFKWPDIKDDPFQETGFCLGMKTHFGILSDGRVVPCCLDWAGNSVLGNATENNLQDILESQKAINIKDSFANNVLPEDICKRCDYIKVFTAKNKCGDVSGL